MSAILSIETSTNVCSVSFSERGKVLSFKESLKGKTHASQLNIFIDEILEKLKKVKNDISAIALSAGPGSYTGLRIGTSTAKGLCYALDIPLITINSLEIMAYGFLQRNSITSDEVLLMPVIDARRMEVFTSIYNTNLATILPTQPFVLEKEKIDSIKENKEIIVFGNASKKCASVFGNIGYKYEFDFTTSANFMSQLAHKKLLKKDFSNTPYFEPFYAKAFYSTK